jgi:hypothetical protein
MKTEHHEIPVCPNCGNAFRLVLTWDRLIVCTKDAGGCGMHTPIDKVSEVYTTVVAWNKVADEKRPFNRKAAQS